MPHLPRPLALLGLLAISCSGPQPAAPASTPTPPPALTLSAPQSDAERVEDLWINPVHAWATSSLGVLRFSRPAGPFERLKGSPIGGHIVVDDLGVPYIGLDDGVAWMDETGAWRRLSDGALRGGVRALAPQPGGGVWVALSRGLGRIEGGALRSVAPTLRVTDALRATDGALWLATADEGLLRVRGAQAERLGPEHGLCGPGARALAEGAGRVVALCGADGLSIFSEAGGRAYAVKGLSGALKRAQPWGTGVILEVQGGAWLRLRPGPSEGAVIAQPQPAPAPKPAPQPAQQPTSQPTSQPAPQPASQPAPQPTGDLRPRPAPIKLAPATPLGASPFTPPVAQPSAVHFATDASIWYADPGRGLVVVEGARTRRLSARSLRPSERTLLLVDPEGRPLMVVDGAALKREGGVWRPWRISEGRVLSLGLSGTGEVLALTEHEGRLQLWQGLKAWRKLIDRPMFGLDGPARCGQLHATADGAYYAALFWLNEQQKLRGEGLLRLSAEGLQIWEGGLDEPEPGTRALPDSWVNRVLIDRGGALWVATNAGLMRLRGEDSRVFDENDFMDSDAILDIAEDAHGVIWLATLEGLGRLEGDRWVSAAAAGLKGRVDALASAQGILWASAGGALFCQGASGWRRVIEGLGEVRAIRPGHGVLWILSREGLRRFDAPPQCD